MKNIKKFRDNGAIGALLDEYERAISELKQVINNIHHEELISIVDTQTKDNDCRSIQTILSHVVRAGYGYVTTIRIWLGEELQYRQNSNLLTIREYLLALDEMFEDNVAFFNKYPNVKLEEFDTNKKINVSWGQQYDIEQLYEHAIVHVLRHRRQIERFIVFLNNKDERK